MGFPARRFQSAGATSEELVLLEEEFAALAPNEQTSEEGVLASVDEVALMSRLEGLRGRPLVSVLAGQGTEKPADGSSEEAEKPKRASKASE